MQPHIQSPSRRRRGPAPGTKPFLKTCQTCHHAKIRCDRTRDDAICDRCLRLHKTCIYLPTKPKRSRANSSSQSKHSITTPESMAKSSDDGHQQHDVPPTEQPTISAASTHQTSPVDHDHRAMFEHGQSSTGLDPFSQDILSEAHGQDLLNLFRTTMTPHFPFLQIPLTTTIEAMRTKQPFLLLAIMFAASYRTIAVQRRLARMCEQNINNILVSGKITQVDILQGLLVYLAWAHYQPRPRKFTQYLHLATSIVSDLRLDQPRRSKYGRGVGASVQDALDDDGWDQDTARALVGTWYLSSSSSVTLHKMRHFSYSRHISRACEWLASRPDKTSLDEILPHIISLQKISEDIDDAGNTQDGSNADINGMKSQIDIFKRELDRPLSSCPALALQLHATELLINQLFLPGSSHSDTTPENKVQHPSLLDSVSESISSIKSLISLLLSLPQGQEFAMTNSAWLLLGYGLSLAVRLDLVIAQHVAPQATSHMLRKSLDIQHTLKQVILRLQTAVTEQVDERGDRDAFWHILKRARAIQGWYLEQRAVLDEKRDGDGPGSGGGSESVSATSPNDRLSRLRSGATNRIPFSNVTPPGVPVVATTSPTATDGSIGGSSSNSTRHHGNNNNDTSSALQGRITNASRAPFVVNTPGNDGTLGMGVVDYGMNNRIGVDSEQNMNMNMDMNRDMEMEREGQADMDMNMMMPILQPGAWDMLGWEFLQDDFSVPGFLYQGF